MPGSREILFALRPAVLLLLLIAIVLPRADGGGEVVELGPAPDPGVAAAGARLFVRRSLEPPSADELEILAGLGAVAPIVAAAPALPATLEADPPRNARALRNASLGWVIRAAPFDTVRVRLRDRGGPLDSARIAADSSGTAAGAFRVRPRRPGWHEWVLQSGDDERVSGAWVAPADTPRVLIASGPMSLEAREVARALERAGGFAVTLAPALGRDLRLGHAPAGLPASPAALAAWDVILVLDGTPVTQAQATLLRDFMDDGGGVLLSGRAVGALGLARVQESGELSASAIRWTAPAELDPLPPASLDAAVSWIEDPGGLSVPAAHSERGSLLLLGQPGRGRWAGLGIAETWRWSLEAGRLAELAAFWGSLAGWLGGGIRAPAWITVEPEHARPGASVRVRIEWFADAEPTRFVFLDRPDGATDTLPVAWRGAMGETRFVADTTGPHALRLPGEVFPRAGHEAVAAARPASGAWARLALVVAASSGRLVPPDSIDPVIRAQGTGGGQANRMRWLALAALLIAMIEWAVRRLRGSA